MKEALKRILERLFPGKRKTSRLREMAKKILTHKMSDEEKEAQRCSFAYGNVNIHNPNVTREMVDEIAEKKNRDGELYL